MLLFPACDETAVVCRPWPNGKAWAAEREKFHLHMHASQPKSKISAIDFSYGTNQFVLSNFDFCLLLFWLGWIQDTKILDRDSWGAMKQKTMNIRFIVFLNFLKSHDRHAHFLVFINEPLCFCALQCSKVKWIVAVNAEIPAALLIDGLWIAP